MKKKSWLIPETTIYEVASRAHLLTDSSSGLVESFSYDGDEVGSKGNDEDDCDVKWYQHR